MYIVERNNNAHPTYTMTLYANASNNTLLTLTLVCMWYEESNPWTTLELH